MNAAFQETTTSLTWPYSLVKKVGEGGTAEVWEGLHLGLGRRVAVKFLKPECLNRGNARRRFLAEARALACVDSSYVVSVCDIGETPDGAPFMIMELLNGATLRSQLAAQGALAPVHALQLLTDAAFGVAAIHAAGFVHRDLKPENLFVNRRNNEGETCKVLDLGLAKHHTGENLTRDGALVGTVRYMAPEQARGEATDPRTDIYALGLVLYELITGRPFIDEETEPAQLFRIMNPPAPLQAQLASMPAPLIEVLARALAPEPRARWATAAELAERLRRVGDSLRLVSIPKLLPSSVLQANVSPAADTAIENEALLASGEQSANARSVPDATAFRPGGPKRTRLLSLGLALVGLGGAAWTALQTAQLGPSTQQIPPTALVPVPAASALPDATALSQQPLHQTTEIPRPTTSAGVAPSPLAGAPRTMRRSTVRPLPAGAVTGNRNSSVIQRLPVLQKAPQTQRIEPIPVSASTAQRLRYSEENPYELSR
jgi:serine/threonine protein kinase